ncbi:hypothetical protein [Brachybacterium massiliense]|uniref:hypothetical protein n=1 Tax=Brachybacterium massiliense TaxID=1755098 RepID=UPI001FE5AF05|nr:hypothetical protein [Brachybacterium massiliense]
MIAVGKGAARRVPNVHLTRFAAYFVALNADQSKPEVRAQVRLVWHYLPFAPESLQVLSTRQQRRMELGWKAFHAFVEKGKQPASGAAEARAQVELMREVLASIVEADGRSLEADEEDETAEPRPETRRGRTSLPPVPGAPGGGVIHRRSPLSDPSSPFDCAHILVFRAWLSAPSPAPPTYPQPVNIGLWITAL